MIIQSIHDWDDIHLSKEKIRLNVALTPYGCPCTSPLNFIERLRATMDRLVCIEEIEEAAINKLDPKAVEFYAGGSEEEWTLRENKNAFRRWLISPRVLRDVSVRDLSTSVLGKPVSIPLGVSPTAMQKLAHPDGEIAAIKAVEESGSIYILSTQSSTSMEEVAAAAPNCRKWFQLYVFKARSVSADLVRRAEAAGFEALVLTVDTPLVGRRRNLIRESFSPPDYIRLANYSLQNLKRPGDGPYMNVMDAVGDQSLSWEDIKWLRSMTKLPIIIKGIMTAEDALLAMHYGVAGIFVSNHGGRQLDFTSATIDILPEIVKAVDGKLDIYMDGGVTTGSDVFKALALGATMVFIGRPLLWGLTMDGQSGAKKVLDIYREELSLVMALTGVSRINDITGKYLKRKSNV